ncbi:MAG: ATP-dependent DNA ligase [Propionibacterium sp.]|nr:ATP-dependent DNA ligase [Propionibacterium sp.]
MVQTPHSIGGRDVPLHSPQRVLFPEVGFTKADLREYLEAVSEVLLPQLLDRPVTRVRFPRGITGTRFFERNTPAGAPRWLRRQALSASPGTPATSGRAPRTVTYPFIDGVDGLRWMADQAALEFHTPQWRAGPRGAVHRPDRLVIDLDPGEGAGLAACARVAHLVRARLARDGLDARPVTSGGRGLHLYAAVPGESPVLARGRTSRAVHAYVHDLARELAGEHPDLVVARSGAEHRVGRVFLDWSQNHPARSTATPYTLRARGPRPTVAAPRHWEEIGDRLTQLGPEDVVARLHREGDRLAAPGRVPPAEAAAGGAR